MPGTSDTIDPDAMTAKTAPLTEALSAARGKAAYLRLVAADQREMGRDATAEDYLAAADMIDALVSRVRWEANV